jgi:HEAT repeat protein
VLPQPEAGRRFLGSPDPVVRAVAVYLLTARRVGEAGQYRRALEDPDHRVRIEAVRALVSIDDADGVSVAAGDDNREVRVAAANGLATLGAGVATVRRLIADPDPLVRAAALAALGDLGGVADDVAAVPRLAQTLADEHLDVRKVAVLGLTRWAASEAAARDALAIALKDDDADVRAYARRALAASSPNI